jgi:hypothetical protein
MPGRKMLSLLLVLASCALAAAPAYVDLEQRLTPEQLHATGLDTLSPVQLSLLNHFLRDEAATRADAAQQREEEAQQSSRLIGLNDQPIVSRLVGTVTESGPGTVFELENGQRWKVLKGHYKLAKPVQSPEVRIVPGAAGRWFFKLDEDTPGPRVYRID